MMRLIGPIWMTFALALVLGACSSPNLEVQVAGGSADDQFPNGLKGEQLFPFQDGAAGDLASRAAALRALPEYPEDQGIPGSLDLDSGAFGIPGSRGAEETGRLTVSSFSPPVSPLLVLSGYPALDFGQVGLGETAVRTLVLANVGRQPLALLSLELAPADPAFRHVRNDCEPVMLPMTRCEVELAFAPTGIGVRERLSRVLYLKPDGSVGAAYRVLRGEGSEQEGGGTGPAPEPGAILAGLGAGGHTSVTAFGSSGGSVIEPYVPYHGFHGGATVASGDVNGDGVADVITGAWTGGGPHVQVVDGSTRTCGCSAG